jgi:hypothetical protein
VTSGRVAVSVDPPLTSVVSDSRVAVFLVSVPLAAVPLAVVRLAVVPLAAVSLASASTAENFPTVTVPSFAAVSSTTGVSAPVTTPSPAVSATAGSAPAASAPAASATATASRPTAVVPTVVLSVPTPRAVGDPVVAVAFGRTRSSPGDCTVRTVFAGHVLAAVVSCVSAAVVAGVLGVVSELAGRVVIDDPDLAAVLSPRRAAVPLAGSLSDATGGCRLSTLGCVVRRRIVGLTRGARTAPAPADGAVSVGCAVTALASPV